MIHLDYETYSPLDLTEVGVFRYAEDPDAEILMAAVASDTEGPFLLVNPRYEDVRPSDQRGWDILWEHAENPSLQDEVWAHNAQFEFAVSKALMVRCLGLRPPPIEAWRCTALLCRRAGLPASLDKACEVLKLPHQKDKKGKALIKKFSMPDPKTGKRTLPQDDPVAFREFCDYCLQDVRAEMALHAALKPFSAQGDLLAAFHWDLKVNARGFAVDIPALKAAEKIIAEADEEIGADFMSKTGLRHTQRAKVQDWLNTHGLAMPNLQSATVAAVLEEPKWDEAGICKRWDLWDQADGLGATDGLQMPLTKEEVLAVLELYASIQFAAVKKVETMLTCVCDDGRVRGGLQFHGAAPGKWSGRLVQPQNFKKPKKEHRVFTGDFLTDLKAGVSREGLSLLYGNPIDVMASSIRHFISGPLFDADYNAIEARIALWLAGQENVLERFRKGQDLYKWMAAPIFGISESAVDADQRQLGKVTILGCQYQMWWPKFQSAAKVQYGLTISDELAEKAVLTYRRLCDCIVGLWEALENAARSAITHPGQWFRAGKHLAFKVAQVGAVPFLIMKLPSGRSIAYPWPALEADPRRDGKVGISFYGNIKGETWGRVWTFGGSILENATTGTAFDIMAYGGMKAEAAGYPVSNLIHDQALADFVPGLSIEGYVKALTTLPPWAEGLPIKAEGKITPYYTK